MNSGQILFRPIFSPRKGYRYSNLKNGLMLLHEWNALKFTKMLIKSKIDFIYIEEGEFPNVDITIYYGKNVSIAKERLRNFKNENAVGKV